MTKLTIKELQAMSPADAGRVVRDDGGLRGKVQRNARAEGGASVTFEYRYRWEGKTRNEPCGTWPRDKISMIRGKRDKVRALIDANIDPVEHRRTEQLKVLADAAQFRRKLAEEQAHELTRLSAVERLKSRQTVRQVFTRWSELELIKRKDGGAETKRGIEKDVMRKMGERYADEITRADIMNVLDTVKARGASRLANRLLAELRQMFGFALVREIVTTDPTAGIEKKHVGGQEEERDRVLSEAEIKALPAKLEAANLLDSSKHGIWVMLGTLARMGELTRARITDIDIDAGTWTIPAEHSKNTKEHTIYLSDFAKRHMRGLLALTTSDIWLFPATRTDGPVSSKSITKQVYDRQGAVDKHPLKKRSKKIDVLKLPGGRWTPHDLRRTGATLMGELGVHGDVIEKCLNHLEQSRIKRTYQRAVREQEQRDAWAALGARLDLLT